MTINRRITTSRYARLRRGGFAELFVFLVDGLVDAVTEFDFTPAGSISLLFVFLGELLVDPCSLYPSTCQHKIHPKIHILF
ncbi:hypothetical protein BT93_G0339 [Corymbia citriodora subsp. variegata]|nr:hypothetical protein BT93_G0339 [Corymbia citriodora subsp. variegata]